MNFNLMCIWPVKRMKSSCLLSRLKLWVIGQGAMTTATAAMALAFDEKSEFRFSSLFEIAY